MIVSPTIVDPLASLATPVLSLALLPGNPRRGVDVICKRYQLATGVLPIAEATGNTHDFCGQG